MTHRRFSGGMAPGNLAAAFLCCVTIWHNEDIIPFEHKRDAGLFEYQSDCSMKTGHLNGNCSDVFLFSTEKSG